MPKISVLIPTIRTDNLLDLAVESVLLSEHVDLEIIVFHDGVPPNPESPWSKDSRVKVIKSSHRIGQTKGMNKLIENASGQYLARLDADDISTPERLYLQSQFLDQNPTTVAVGSSMERIDQLGCDLGPLDYPHGPDVRRHMLLQNVIPHSTLMFRKTTVDSVGDYNSGISQMEDYEFILRLAQHGKVANLEQRLVSYRIHSDQLSRGAKPYGDHITSVLKQRRVLGKKLGVNPIEVLLKNLIWVTVQYLRYYRVRKPGYDRK